MNAIDVKNINVYYNNHQVLHDINFHVEKGDFIAIVGPNGSGKTTLIKTIMGLIKPASGTIEINGKPIDSNGYRKNIGYLPQIVERLDPRFPATVNEVVSSGIRSKKKFPGRLDQEDISSIKKSLELLKINDLCSHRIGELSGGQQQRVLLARALVDNSSMLILDEPTGALDPQTRDSFYDTLMHFNQHHNVTVLLVTHDSHSFGKFANKILYIDRKIKFFGDFNEFDNTPDMVKYFGHDEHCCGC